MKPIHEVWVSTDSCQEHWGWEDIEELDPRVKVPTDPSAHRYIYTADQLREVQVKVLREARDRMAVTNELNPLAFLDRMADELEKQG